MRAVVMDVREHNTVHVGDERYFLLCTEGRLYAVHDRCPHRGGPLSLGRVTSDGKRLACPWHGTRVGLAALRRTALPLVRAGSEVTVVVSDRDPRTDRNGGLGDAASSVNSAVDSTTDRHRAEGTGPVVTVTRRWLFANLAADDDPCAPRAFVGSPGHMSKGGS